MQTFESISRIRHSRNGNEHQKKYRNNWLYAWDFDRRGSVMGRQSLNIVGDTAWLFVVVLRDLLHARRWALVGVRYTPESGRSADMMLNDRL